MVAQSAKALRFTNSFSVRLGKITLFFISREAMKFVTASLLSLFVCGTLCNYLNADDPKQDKQDTVPATNEIDANAEKMVGVYRISGGERNGQPIPMERLVDITVRVTPKVITTFDKDKKEFYAATYELDTTRTPWRITLTATMVPIDGRESRVDGRGAKSEGLVQIEGDTLKLVYQLPDGKSPNQFKTEEKQQMFILKRSSK
jgi:uncharacterized protein (TIGR03067 family)